MPDPKKTRNRKAASRRPPPKQQPLSRKGRTPPPKQARHSPPPHTRPAQGKKRQPPDRRAAPKTARSAPPAAIPREPDRAAAIQNVQRRRRRRHKRNYTLYYIILFFFLTVTGAVLSLTVFFNIETIRVEGSEIYTQEDILPMLGAQPGDNLLRIDTGKMEEELLAALPQADTVKILREFPSGLRVSISDGVPSAQLAIGDAFYIVSRNGRILQQSDTALPGCGVVICGVQLENMEVGDYIADVQEENWKEASELAEKNKEAPPEKPRDIENLQALFGALKAAQFSDVNAVDITDEVSLTVYWQNRIQILLGSFSELDYKLRFVHEILTDEAYAEIIPPESTGILDAQAASSVLPFQPAAEIAVPGGGVDSWSWDDVPAQTQEEESSQPSESSESSDGLFEPGEESVPEPELEQVSGAGAEQSPDSTA